MDGVVLVGERPILLEGPFLEVFLGPGQTLSPQHIEIIVSIDFDSLWNEDERLFSI